MLSEIWIKNKSLLKFIGMTATTAMTIRFFYVDSFNLFRTAESTVLTLAAKRESSSDQANLRHNPDHHLVSVLMLTRHGARTPINIISELEEAEYNKDLIDPFVKAKYKLKTLDNDDMHDILSKYDQMNFNKKLKGGSGRGQLTHVGEKQMFDLGRRVRERYVNQLKFISKDYNPDEFYTRSTHFRRTIHSAKSLLAGIFAESHTNIPDDPFIINVHDLSDEYLFPNALNCTYFAELHAFFDKLSLYKNKEYVDSLNELNRALTDTGKSAKNTNYTYTVFRDDMLARQVHNLPVPPNLEPFLVKADRYANMELTASHQHNVKIACGLLLGLLKEALQTSLSNHKHKTKVNEHKFRLYSAHDSTLNALLVAFNLIDDDSHSWPPFAADLTFELWESNSNNANSPQSSSGDAKVEDYFVRVYYCGNLLSFPECESATDCRFADFVKMLDKYRIEKHEYKHMCSQKFP